MLRATRNSRRLFCRTMVRIAALSRRRARASRSPSSRVRAITASLATMPSPCSCRFDANAAPWFPDFSAMPLASGKWTMPLARLHNPVTPIYRLGPRTCRERIADYGGQGASLERSRVAKRISGTGAQRRFSAAELLPAVAVVLAGRHQGRVPRAGQHRRQLRPRGALAELRDEAPERRLA